MKAIFALTILALAILAVESRHRYHNDFCKYKYPGHYRHPKSCTHFIQCDAFGKGHVMPCGPGTVFNPYIGVCDHKNYYACGSYKPYPYPKPKYPYHGYKCYRPGHFKHPYSCTKFIQCDEHHSYGFVMRCPPKTVFNPKIGVCDWPYNYHCGYKPVYKHGYKPYYYKHYYINPCYKKPDGAFLPFHKDCRYYTRCAHGRPILMQCAPGTIWNQKYLTCKHHRSYYKHPYYYQCKYYY